MAIEPQPHMVVMPRAINILRGFQMVFAVFVLAVSIYGAVGGAVAGVGLNLFTSLATIIILIYILVATHSQPMIYNYWAILALEIFLVIFWLISFAVLASEVALASAYDCGGGYYDYYGNYYYTSCDSATKGIIGLFGACAGIGAIEFILFIVTLALFSVRLSAHRRNGGPSTPGALATGGPQSYNPNTSVGHEKIEMQPQAQPQTYPTTGAAQNAHYPQQGVDPRYGGEPVTQSTDQYPAQHQVPQQLPTHQDQYVQ